MPDLIVPAAAPEQTCKWCDTYYICPPRECPIVVDEGGMRVNAETDPVIEPDEDVCAKVYMWMRTLNGRCQTRISTSLACPPAGEGWTPTGHILVRLRSFRIEGVCHGIASMGGPCSSVIEMNEG